MWTLGGGGGGGFYWSFAPTHCKITRNKLWAYICSKSFFYWVYFRGSVFSDGLVIGRNFSFQNGFGLSTKTAKDTRTTA